MSLKITNSAVEYSNDFPIYGHLVDQNNLRLALRATGYSNLIDLSPRDGSFTVTPGVTFTPQGPKTVPDGRNIISDYSEQDDSITLITAFKVDRAGRSVLTGDVQYRAYACGSYAGTTAFGGGMGVVAYSSENAGTPGTFDLNIVLRSRLKNRGTGLYGAVVLDAALVTAAAALPATTGWVYAVATFNHVTGEARLRLLNKGVDASFTYAPATWFTDAASRGLVMESTGAPLLHRVGGTVGFYPGSEQNEVYVPHHLLFSGVLSDATIGLQYEADKKWLLAARGIVL